MASKLQSWFATRVAESIRWNAASAALLIPGGALATWLTYWIVWAMISLGLGRLFELSWTTIDIMAAVFVAVIFVWQFTTGRYFEETYALTRDEHAEQKVALTRATGHSWTLLLDLEVASMLVRALTVSFLMGPKMLGASVQLWYRVNRLKKMDVSACGQVVRLLMKAQGRVDIDDVAKKFPEADVVDLVQPLADFDGVVFLQKDSLGLTLAPRLVEDFEKWRQEN
jgi:hypothetical protein